MTKEKENALTTVEANLTSSSMAQLTKIDKSLLEGVELDVSQNKEIFDNDILIPKVFLIQSMSQYRKDKVADEGQFVDSLTGDLLADVDEELRFIVLKTFKRWQTFKVVDNKKEFVSSEIMVFGKNHELPYNETKDGEDLVRRQVISAYVLLEKDVQNGINKPYIIDFAASSKYAGRKMISDISTLNDQGYPSFVGFFKMTAHEEKFENGEAFVKDVKFGGYITHKEGILFLKDAHSKLKKIEDMIEIDDSDVIDAAKSSGQKESANVVNEAAGNADV